MNILTLKAKKFKNLDDVYVLFDPGINQVIGKNSHGKTNLILSLLETVNVSGKFKQMVQNGESEAETEVVLGTGDRAKLKVKAKFKSDKGSRELTLYNATNVPITKSIDGLTKQKILDTIFQAKRIDLSDLNKSDKDLTDYILSMLGIDEQLAEIDAEYNDFYSRRTVANSRKITAEKRLPNVPPKNVVRKNESKVQARFNGLENDLKEYENAINYLEVLDDHRGTTERKIRKLQEELEKINAEYEKAESELPDDPTSDYETVKEELLNLSTINKGADDYERYQIDLEEYNEAKEEWNTLNIDVKANRKQKKRLLVDYGFSLSDKDKILYNDVTISELAENEKIRLLIKLAINAVNGGKIVELPDGTVLDPVKVVVLENGRALDRDRRAEVYRTLKVNGITTIIEKVLNERFDKASNQWVDDLDSDEVEGGKLIVIEEGNVK